MDSKLWYYSLGTVTSIVAKSLTFHSSPNSLRLSCRSQNQTAEIWEFIKESENGEIDLHLIWTSNDASFLADPDPESHLLLRDDGWLFDGITRICWIPKAYRPDNGDFFIRGSIFICIASKHLFAMDLKSTNYVLSSWLRPLIT